MSEQIRFLDDELFDIPLSTVGLESRQTQALEQIDYTTVGEIYDLQAEGIAVALDIDFSEAEAIWDRVLQVVSNPDNWFTSTVSAPTVNFPAILIPTIQSFFADADKPRLYTILVRRFGLNGNDKSTLDDIGVYFDITRERVRQLEVKGLESLRDYLLKGNKPVQKSLFEDKNDALKINQIRAETKTIKQLFEDDVEPVKSEKEIFEVIEARYCTGSAGNGILGC